MRKTYLYRPNHPKANQNGFVSSEELCVDDLPSFDPHVMVFGESHYDGLRATDGTPIDSKAKYRNYLKATGLTPLSDFKESLPKAMSKRINGDPAETRKIRETVGRAFHDLYDKRKRA